MSSRIQALESELNVVLFKRGRGGAALTEAGIELEAPARQIIEIWELVTQRFAA
jgi:DNA-binding transcriptional LysR family regulator